MYSINPQIDSLETTARDVLKFIPSLRNLLQPVNRLPPDILCHIARYVPDKNTRDMRSIIPLTHVYRYWCKSLVSAPRIWTLISSRSKSLATLSLERSKAAPLEIDVNLSTRDRKFSDLLLPHIWNTGSLNVRGLSSIKDLTQALPNFPQSTPNLRSLTLRCVQKYRAGAIHRSIRILDR